MVDAAAGLIDDILGRCPEVTVMATSREALAVPDEVQVTVGPLETPPEDARPGQVLDYPAAQLFVERARAVRPGTVFDADDLRADRAHLPRPGRHPAGRRAGRGPDLGACRRPRSPSGWTTGSPC